MTMLVSSTSRIARLPLGARGVNQVIHFSFVRRRNAGRMQPLGHRQELASGGAAHRFFEQLLHRVNSKEGFSEIYV